MKWTELVITTTQAGLDIVNTTLIDLNIECIAIEDPIEMLAFIKDNECNWDMVDESVITELKNAVPKITVYLANNEQGVIQEREISNAINLLKAKHIDGVGDNIVIAKSMLEDEDWAHNWKKYFKPFTVGENLAVVPTWEEFNNIDNRIILSIDPGTSFGSGLHETTQLCLMELEKQVNKNSVVFDVGCGSGILTVAAAKLGAKKVLGFDIDEKAVSDSQFCIKHNGVCDIASVACADLLDTDETADIIIGNLFANIIVRLTDKCATKLNSGGLLITSGIITDTLDDVKEAYAKSNINIVEIKNIGEWHIVIGQKS